MVVALSHTLSLSDLCDRPHSSHFNDPVPFQLSALYKVNDEDRVLICQCTRMISPTTVVPRDDPEVVSKFLVAFPQALLEHRVTTYTQQWVAPLRSTTMVVGAIGKWERSSEWWCV